jgi:hypothetical protein
MNSQLTTINKQGYYRLIALWVLCEAMLGGIIHNEKAISLHAYHYGSYPAVTFY